MSKKNWEDDDAPVVFDVGYVCSRCETDDGREMEVIGLLTSPDQEDPDFWMTVGAVKNLIETLKEAVEHSLDHNRRWRDGEV